MKRILFLCLLTLSLSTPAVASVEINGIYYEEASGGVRVVSANSTGYYKGDIVIPSSVHYNDPICNVDTIYNVTGIGDNAFAQCTELTSVSIPNTVTYIESEAFYGCSSLTSVSIPRSVTSIDNSVFYGCSSLTSVSIPSSVTSIGFSAFCGCI